MADSREAQVPRKTDISLPVGALEGLQSIAAALQRSGETRGRRLPYSLASLHADGDKMKLPFDLDQDGGKRMNPRYCLTLMMKNGLVFSKDSTRDLIIGPSRYPRQVSKETYLKECEALQIPMPSVSPQEGASIPSPSQERRTSDLDVAAVANKNEHVGEK